MKKKYKVLSLIILSLLASAFALFFLLHGDIAVLNPKGEIGEKQSRLLTVSTLLMLIIVIPVYLLAFFIVWKYRADNKKASYKPDWDYSLLAESIWWGLPCVIILILSILTWTSSHELDPFKPIDRDKKPLTIQVVALQWKWLFIYPEQKIATVNFFQFPENTPVHFEITADAPMNSFWIPKLGGQIFAMAGMTTQLYLIAKEPGSYRGSSANLSGEGFSGMEFIAQASSDEDFNSWVNAVKNSPSALDLHTYIELAKPSSYDPVKTYCLQDESLYDWIVMKYMMPMPKMEH